MTIPQAGWYCTRQPGHDCLCDASPEATCDKSDEVVSSFSVTRKQVEQTRIWMKTHNEQKSARKSSSMDNVTLARSVEHTPGNSQVLNGHRESAKGDVYRHAGTPE